MLNKVENVKQDTNVKQVENAKQDRQCETMQKILIKVKPVKQDKMINYLKRCLKTQTRKVGTVEQGWNR